MDLDNQGKRNGREGNNITGVGKLQTRLGMDGKGWRDDTDYKRKRNNVWGVYGGGNEFVGMEKKAREQERKKQEECKEGRKN